MSSKLKKSVSIDTSIRGIARGQEIASGSYSKTFYQPFSRIDGKELEDEYVKDLTLKYYKVLREKFPNDTVLVSTAMDFPSGQRQGGFININENRVLGIIWTKTKLLI